VDIKTVCLGILSLGEASGYDIKQRFERTYRHFFAAGYGSIYPALANLAERGLVRFRVADGPGPRPRKVYSLTVEGRRELRARLAEAEPRHRVHSDFMLLMFLAGELDTDRVETVIDARLDEVRRHYASLALRHQDAAGGDPGPAFVRGLGLALLQTTARYLEDNRDGFAAALRTRARGDNASFNPSIRGDTS